MAERKYDLALVNTVTKKPVKPQLWYKERLQTKYIKKLKPGERMNNNNTVNWIFMKDGLDDFRDGLPPAVQGSDFLKSEKGPGPNINGDINKNSTVKQPAARKRLSRYQTYYSRCSPQQQQRRDYINEVEQGLLKHPLALYPHLEESVAPERKTMLFNRLKKLGDVNLKSIDQIKIFEDIVDLLDPQFNCNDLQDLELDLLEEEEEKEISDSSSYVSRPSSRKVPTRQSVDTTSTTVREVDLQQPKNPYRWLPRKETKKDGKRGSKEKESTLWPSAASEEEHIKKVTQDFCDWVADLGGESNNIEESTITSLFASGYETKPALSVPIHVVELTNVPQELRLSAAIPPPPPQKQSIVDHAEPPDAEQAQGEEGTYQPSWVKFKYGAWYLNPRTWKKMDVNEPLMDPKQIKDQEMSEAKKKSNTLNQELASMHAAKAFSDFITKKGCRKPEFLVEVSEIQRRAHEEEMRRTELEQIAKTKKMSISKKQSIAVGL